MILQGDKLSNHLTMVRVAMKLLCVILSIIVLSVPVRGLLTKNETVAILDSTIAKSTQIMDNLFNRWQVAEFPNFLQSAGMSHTSYEILKVKFVFKILTSLNAPTKAEKMKNMMIISFLGSSVTAGHDTAFDQSFSELTRDLMKPAFEEIGIGFEVRNGAMGNNPCMPYDQCVRTFAGLDADMILWEQSFNCNGRDAKGRDVFEQFIRQTMSMKTNPIIVFTGSSTPNWGEDKCKEKKEYKISEDDKKLLSLYTREKSVRLLVQLNTAVTTQTFAPIATLFPNYKMSGVQTWTHDSYLAYQCHGPYVPTWGCCSMSWHPSKLGHQLRAAHYTFFWLAIYKDALESIRERLITGTVDHFSKVVSEIDIDAMLEETTKHYHHEHKHTQAKAVWDTDFSDDIKCITAFEPIHDKDSELGKFVINNQINKAQFIHIIFEQFMDKKIIIKAKEIGYKDYKWGYVGNKESKPLSVKIKVTREGLGHVCQPPGVWGKMPVGMKNLWDTDTKFYLTLNVKSWQWLEPRGEGENNGTFVTPSTNVNLFTFKPEEGKLMTFINKELCVIFNEKFPPGDHVLTIVATQESNIMVSTILYP